MGKWFWVGAILLWVAHCSALAVGEERLDWGTRAVFVDQVLPMPGDVPPEPGVIFADVDGGEGAYSFYHYAVRANWRAGSRVALGLLEGEFESTEWVEAKSFGREVAQIRLELTYHPRGGKPAQKHLPDRRKQIAFSAILPQDLPAGEYTFRFELRDEEGRLRQSSEAHLVRSQRTNPLAALDDAALVKQYIRRGGVLKDTDIRPADGGPLLQAAIAYEDPRYQEYWRARQEIVGRGSRMEPLLIELLKAEAVRNPGLTDLHPDGYGLSHDIMGMMRQLPYPRPVPLLVDILEGMSGKTNIAVRLEALTTVEAMTYVSFGHHWYGAPDSSAVRHAGAVSFQNLRKSEDYDARLKEVAALFRQWLAGEGKDPSQWLSIARKRARELMESGDEELILNGIAFLQGAFNDHKHDDDPERTMDRIAVHVRNGGGHDWYWLPKYGPRAQRHIDLLLAKSGPASEKWSQLQALADVGGEKAMARLLDEIKETNREIRRRGAGPAEDWFHVSDREERNAALAYEICRWGVARWAGRVFANDDAIQQWWSESKGQSQRQWLEENLEKTAVDADGGNAEAQSIIRLMLPDLPHDSEDLQFNRPGRWTSYYYWEHPVSPFRVAWLKEHRGQLVYDEQRGGFIIPSPPR